MEISNSEKAGSDVVREWRYDVAFSRHYGLISKAEQELLRRARIAIAGMGGVGGAQLMTLVRLGIGGFNIADPDVYEVANFNRQYGATTSSIGRSKAQVMADLAWEVNPEVELKVFEEKIEESNVDRFLDGVDLVIDGLDIMAIDTRRVLFRAAARHSIYAVTAGPIGFASAILIFDPNGMAFDDYFDLRDSQDEVGKMLRFGVGISPSPTHLPYMSQVSIKGRNGPSLGLAINLCAAMTATEVTRILLHRGKPKCVPHYSQFDPYRRTYRRGYVPWGNRNPIQRFKLWLARRRYV